MLDEQSACIVSRTPLPTADFTQSMQFSPNPTNLPPPPTPSVNKLYASLGAIACSLVAYGVASLFFLLFRKCAIYDHVNYLLIDV